MTNNVLQFVPRPRPSHPLQTFASSWQKIVSDIVTITADSPVFVAPDGRTITLMTPPTERMQPQHMILTVEQFNSIVKTGMELLGITPAQLSLPLEAVNAKQDAL